MKWEEFKEYSINIKFIEAMTMMEQKDNDFFVKNINDSQPFNNYNYYITKKILS